MKIPASGAILIGGKSRRFGSDKAFMEFHGSSAATGLFSRLSSVLEEVWLIADRADKLKIDGAETVVDLIPDCGPLGGLLTALHHSRFEYCFLTACDLPLMEARVVELLWEHRCDADVVIPEHGGYLEPTAAFYHRQCVPAIKDALDGEARNMRSFWDAVKVRRVDLSGMIDEASLERIFCNVNTPENYREAMKLYDFR